MRDRESTRTHGGGAEGTGNKVSRRLHTELRAAQSWTSGPWDHNLSWNRESGAQPTVSPRHPSIILFLKCKHPPQRVKSVICTFVQNYFNLTTNTYWYTMSYFHMNMILIIENGIVIISHYEKPSIKGRLHSIIFV